MFYKNILVIQIPNYLHSKNIELCKIKSSPSKYEKQREDEREHEREKRMKGHPKERKNIDQLRYSLNND